MHKQQTTLITAGGSPGHLRDLSRALAIANINILAVGGAEWRGTGAVSIMVDADRAAFKAVVDAMRDEQDDAHFGIYHSVEVEAVAIALDNTVGALADALDLLADADPPINVSSIQTFPVNGEPTFVSIGVSEADLNKAIDALGHLVVDAHDMAATLGLDPGNG